MGLAAALLLWAGVAVAVEREPEPAGVSSVMRDIPDTARFDQEIAKGNAIWMTETNYGFFGNNFYKRDASLEYPGGRGYEHMVRGGLWVGAQATNEFGEFVGVTCGTVDAAQGPNSTEASEWTPAGLDILKRSTLPTSPFYDPLRAVSELDFVSTFNDFSPCQVANSERHTPMNLEVRQETYQWNFAEFANILFVHFTITNRGPLIKNLWAGIYTELASGCKKCYVNWAPSSSDPSGEGGYFSKKWMVFDDSLAMMREHYCVGFAPPPAPPTDGCNLVHVPYWMGIRHLGTKGLAEDTTTRRMSYSIWNWAPGKDDRDQDIERYALMNNGQIQPFADSLAPSTGDPVELFSVGPFPLVYRDSTVEVDFAFVGGSDALYGGAAGERDVQLNSKFAQFAYDNDYILPIPPPSPRFRVVAREQALDFYWDAESENAYDVTSQPPNDFQGYRLYIGEDPDTMAMVAQFDADGDTASFNTGFGAVTIAPTPIDTMTARYKFTVRGLRDGAKYYCAVTAFDLGNSKIRPLESGRTQNQLVAVPGAMPGERSSTEPTVFPNPYRVEARWDQGATKNVRDHYLWFANLPARCTIRIYTLAGDLLLEKDFDGSGYHGEGTRGIYDPASAVSKPVLSGSMFGWDMITSQGQAIATGLYLYSVEDHTRGDKHYVGKFLVIKSDREGQ